MRVVPFIAVAAASAVLLTGCAGASPAAKPAKATSYDTLAQLRSAYEAAGGRCPVWIEDDDISAAAQSGGCNNGIELSTYLNGADALAETATLRGTDDTGDGSVATSSTELLIGPNWIVDGPSVRKLQPKLGGRLVVVNPNATS